jgi:hypothetical protein
VADFGAGLLLLIFRITSASSSSSRWDAAGLLPGTLIAVHRTSPFVDIMPRAMTQRRWHGIAARTQRRSPTIDPPLGTENGS